MFLLNLNPAWSPADRWSCTRESAGTHAHTNTNSHAAAQTKGLRFDAGTDSHV
jgi:hypothetical protein